MSDVTARARQRRAGATALSLAYPLAGILGLLAALEAWVRLADVQPYVFVPVTDVLQKMVDERSFFFSSAAVTGKEVLVGFAASVAIGVPLAIAIDASRGFERRIYPLLLSSQVTPQIAFVPIIVLWFGFGLKAKAIVVFLFTVFPIVLDTVAGLRSTDREKLFLARSMGAGRLDTLVKIKLPNALPNVFVGLKLAATLAVIGAVVAEFIGASEGLGAVLLLASANLDVATMLGAIGYLTLMGGGFFLLIATLERFALPWHVSRRAGHSVTP